MKKIISKKNKINITITLAIYGIAVIALACIMLEGAGTFVGEWLNYPVVSSYLKNNYSDVECELISTEFVKEYRSKLGVETLTRGYRYTFKASKAGNHGNLKDGDEFVIESYNFSVSRDTIYTDFASDNEIVEKLNDYILSLFKEKADENGGSYEPYALYTDIKIDLNKYENVDDLIKAGELKNGDQVIHIKGESLSFDDYKKLAAQVVGIYQSDDETSELLKPQNLQIFYYFCDENGELVMQFESEFSRYEFAYTEEQIINSTGINYKVLADETEQIKINAYKTVKDVYIWVILGGVVVLGTFWVYKRIRRLTRYTEET